MNREFREIFSRKRRAGLRLQRGGSSTIYCFRGNDELLEILEERDGFVTRLRQYRRSLFAWCNPPFEFACMHDRARFTPVEGGWEAILRHRAGERA